jgi:dTDP-4-dehydrorhamnose 3,5-epimerase
MSEGSSNARSELDRTFAVPLSDQVLGALSFQSYPPQPEIDGVRITPLRKHRGDNGWFMEIFRFEAGRTAAAHGAPGLEMRQISVAYAEPHRMNAFHLHPKTEQEEIWTVIDGALVVWLVDCRRASPSEGARRKVHLSAEEPAALLIPPGVAHGYRATAAGGLLLYGVNQQFDTSDPNEGRLPWDHFGADLWAEDRG